jgi:hypothetical protein
MHEMRASTPETLERLEAFYGSQEPCWPTDPYAFLVWWHCGYPASDVACARGWESLNKSIGVGPEQLLTASTAKAGERLGGGWDGARAKSHAAQGDRGASRERVCW